MAAAAAAAAAAAEPGVAAPETWCTSDAGDGAGKGAWYAGAACNELRAAGGTAGLGAADVRGATPIDAVDAELSNGGSSEPVASRDDEVDEVGIAEAGSPKAGRPEGGNAVGGVDGVDWTEMVDVVDIAAVDATDTPGGGDATASGSSISSSGKSGSCSSKGETGTSPKPLGVVGLAAVAEVGRAAVAVGIAADDAARVGMAADVLTVVAVAVGTAADVLTVVTGSVGTTADAPRGVAATVGTAGDPLTVVDAAAGAAADGFTALAAVGTAVDVLTVAPAAAGIAGDAAMVVPPTVGAVGNPLAVIPAAVGTVGDLLTVVEAAVGAGADGLTVALAAVDLPDEVPPALGTGVPAGAPARTGPVALTVGAFAADEVPLGGTPTGLEIFLAAWPTESEDGALRGAAPAAPKTLEAPVAPIETPTGRDVTPGVFPDGEDATPGLLELTGELPLAPVVAPAAAGELAEAEVALGGALLAKRGAPPLDLVMSTPEAAAEELALPTSEGRPDVLTDPAPRVGAAPLELAAPLWPCARWEPSALLLKPYAPWEPYARLEPSDPLVPSVRGGAFGSEAPSSTSGSSSSADANNSVGISPESAGACGTGGLEAGEVVEIDGAADASGPKSRSAPCASKSSSGSTRPFDGAVGEGAVADAGVDEEGPAPAGDAVPFNPKGSSTGRSAKGSKAGREAGSIVFEPDSGEQS
ncbi:MAG: hypothetical protein JWO04_4325 [Gammaproteobacteria bacterium]|nr:hypothetical protein [Gammaproteobacteria bacterium]